MTCRNIRRPRVDELTVDLVREKVKIVLPHQIADLIHLLAGIQIARRIVGITDQDCLRALCDQFLDGTVFITAPADTAKAI